MWNGWDGSQRRWGDGACKGIGRQQTPVHSGDKIQVHSKTEVWSEQFSSLVKVVNTVQNVYDLMKC